MPLSGVGEAFSTIFVSEIGDKTFFLTMILASRRGRAIALLSSQAALWSMTLLSVSIGVMLRNVSKVSDLPVLNFAAALLMIIFGIQSLRERPTAGSKDETSENEELGEAEEEVAKALKKSETSSSSSFMDWARFTLLIFLAEWGDRSMLATVALASARSPVGVFFGGICGHFIASIFAVLSGGFLHEYIGEQALKTIGGVLFIGFGVTTLLGVY